VAAVPAVAARVAIGKRDIMKRIFLLLILLSLPLRAAEVQSHGYVFEKWVRDTFFEGYEGEYTQHWDIAKEANKKYGGVPVSVKFTKYGSSVDLGDALRQFNVDEKFMLIIGYWKQEGNRKRIVHIIAPVITPQQWRKLFEPITKDDLLKLDATVKNRELTPQQASLEASKIKRAKPFTDAIITLNPKIDSKGQRRLQCSLRFDAVFKNLAPDVPREAPEKPTLFGIEAPPPFVSGPRQFK
jgi:hypothetical protein